MKFFIKLKQESLAECIKSHGHSGMNSIEEAEFWGLVYDEDIQAHDGDGYGEFEIVDQNGKLYKTVVCPKVDISPSESLYTKLNKALNINRKANLH